MLKKLLQFILTLSILTSYSQEMENAYFTWDDFVNNFGKEMVSANDVHEQMVKSGLIDNSLGNFDFHFISDNKKNLERLKQFITEHYPYEIKTLKSIDKGLWELHGLTNEIPVTSENLLFWSLDMYKRGYEFDSKLDGYGALFDHDNPKLPNLDKSQEDVYFDKGMDCYNSGDLSGAIINWSLVLTINPNVPDAYYSRAIVKYELHTWKASISDYDKAIELAPDYTSAIMNRGTVKDENGDYDGALEDYKRALELEPNNAMTYFNIGNTMYNQQNKAKACENWKKAKELGADYAQDRIEQFCE